MSDTVIRVENLGKKYIIGHQQQERYTALRDVLAKQAKGITQLFNPKAKAENLKLEEFWALKDVSFEVKQGDRIGIIGRNGAGKSTLLKILSRITEPTEGRISIKGRVASLLEVGTGFHPELTGRENIYLNGAILGMSKLDIRRKFDEIVAFAEVEKFLDTPVKRYSSGMYVRLAFAVAAHLEPEILIVDEVLAVGDAAFQKKCLGKMEDVAEKEGRTVLFVSHNLGTLQTLCRRGILLAQGKVVKNGTAVAATNSYLEAMEKNVTTNLSCRKDRKGRGKIRLVQVQAIGINGDSTGNLVAGQPAKFIFTVNNAAFGLTCVFTFYDQQGHPISCFNSANRSSKDEINTVAGDHLVCEIDELLLLPGRYRINVALMSDGEVQDHIESAYIFDVEQGHIQGRTAYSSSHGSIMIPHQWGMGGHQAWSM
ncbi:ABC transporter ATP-binding protein [Nodosilinea sp. LEGE 06152]|uniref:ABC transporter ATP-binding protein n=1 Tax=Nodosilinea sp. LEGE 06152 TaxID=2777966 RepID=UPI0018825FD3|nr:ABC transporter ATP-binding protein [Nodosilinea sp. LEGE 06152]MBE9158419.1 ABC transporter ATP-binding protein [Nodosilinea sp. LEGE 06152]